MADNQTSSTIIAGRIRDLISFQFSHFAGVTLALTYVLMLLGAYTNAIEPDSLLPIGRRAMEERCER